MSSTIFLITPLLGATPTAKNTDSAASAVNAEADIETFADFFIPSEPIRDLVLGGCEVTYKAALDKDTEVEQAMPGIHARMLAAASLYCRSNYDRWLSDARTKVKDYWRSELSAEDRHRLAALFAKPTAQAQAIDIQVRPGENLQSATQRSTPALEAHREDFHRRQEAFANTPGGPALLNKVAAYQQDQTKQLMSPSGPASIVRNGIEAAHAAANAYAAEKGLGPVYQ